MTQIGGVQSVCLGVTVYLILGEYNNLINLEGHNSKSKTNECW